MGALEVAGGVYRRKLFEPEGARALAYLRGRGLSDAVIARWGLGWSGGEGWDGPLAGVMTEDVLWDAGLLVWRAGDGRSMREFFLNRVMFPICDRDGVVVSFGGRMLGDGHPKYINGRETPVFSKRSALFGLHVAGDAVRRGAPMVVVEGYMDVIALHQAGFDGAVAPLGTALTVEQLEELWRVSPQPVVCFDGDEAGQRAAMRVAELALPLLSSERTLRFAALPKGEDPDSLVRKLGAGAFEAVLYGSRDMCGVWVDGVLGGMSRDTPEQRVLVTRRFRSNIDKISDVGLRAQYQDEVRHRRRVVGVRYGAGV